MIEEDGLKGVTSNPSIFEKAIAESDDYDDMIAESAADGATDPKAVYEKIAIRDIQDAADVLKTVYNETQRRDGYVTSVSRSHQPWLMTPKGPWKRRGGFGRACRAKTS